MGESSVKYVHKGKHCPRTNGVTAIKVNDNTESRSIDENQEITKDKSRLSINSKHKRRLEIYKFLQLTGIFMLLIFLNTCAWVAEKKIYGEECMSADECNERELLSCGSNGRCNCSPSHSLLYDYDLQRCVARVGEKCGSGVRGDISFSVLCVDGAICDESSGAHCVCTDDFFRLINGTCLRKRKYMEVCQYDSECSKDNSKSLVCFNGHCICDPNTSFYEEERKHCVTRVDRECNPEVSRYRNECPENAYCVDGLCKCEESYSRTLSGDRCALGFGALCKGGGECSDIYFQCLDGSCRCKFPLHQLFDSKSRECLRGVLDANEFQYQVGDQEFLPISFNTTLPISWLWSTIVAIPNPIVDSENTLPFSGLVGGPCTLNWNLTTDNDPIVIQRCTKNAICTDQGFYRGCECMEGFVQRIHTGECAPGYGESCEAMECDPITPLYCKNGRCDCQDELQYYDRNRKRCLGLIGTRCNPQEVNQCVQFASCIQVGSELEGKCFCDRYAQEIENRTCAYNEA